MKMKELLDQLELKGLLELLDQLGLKVLPEPLDMIETKVLPALKVLGLLEEIE